jgi:DNA-binding transcriptional LysR family regulator
MPLEMVMSVNVDFDKLKRFVAVGEELHFTRAAENRLHVSQPWLSRSVRSLEEKLGVQLFYRHSRRVELTAPGRRFLYGARKLIHDFDRTVSAVVQEKKGGGHLTVGYSSYVDLHFIAALKEISCAGSSPATISFESSSSEETAHRVWNREWDCGIVILPVESHDLEVIPLFVSPLAAAMPRAHRLARRRALDLRDLRDECLILGGKRRDSQFRGWLLSRLSDAGIAPRIVEEAAGPHEAQYLVTRGIGIALSNSGAFRTSPEGVVVRFFPSKLVQTQTAIVLRRERHSSLITASVNQILRIAKSCGSSRLAVRSVP